jgi:adenine-specific DNA-methyltransferase
MNTDKLDLQSPDLVNQNVEKIAALFPNCVTESAEGKAIDFDLLKQELNHAVVEGNKERYRLEWPGKREAIVTANIPTTKTLRPVREDSVDFDNTENIYIEGDNLEVLKLLQESYLGKIKMIYIDPPYNTGKDFVYKDNFSKDTQEELLESGQKDEYNQRLVANPETAGRYHSNWLSMMYPRLKLARNLLTDDGVIFISIDDSEVDNLKKLCAEIFGDQNFIQNILWKKRGGPPNDKILGATHDYILAYSKDLNNVALNKKVRTDDQLNRYTNPDNHPKGKWAADNLMANVKGGRFVKSLHYPIVNPNTKEEHFPGTDGNWRYNQAKMQELLDGDEIYFGKDGKGRPKLKRFLKNISEGVPYPTIWDFTPYNNTAAKEIQNLFGNISFFETPKPTGLIKELVKLGSNDNDIILDFFAGSATTADAILQLNSEIKEKRKFIQVQLPEKVSKDSESFKLGFKTLSGLAIERIRRAAKKIKEETNADIDYGFRVYRLDESNMQDVYYKPQDYSQGNLDLFADNVKPDRTADDLLAQVMLDWGLPLSLKIEQATIAGKQVFKVAENSLFACFDAGIDEAFAKEIAKELPLRIVFRDNGFKDDTAKVNVKQLLKQLSPETEMKVI